MNTESEHWLKKARDVKTVSVKGKIKSRGTRILQERERSEREEELGQINEQLSMPSWVLTNTGATAERIAGLHRRKEQIEEELERDAAPENLEGETKDEIEKRIQELEPFIKEGMLSEEEMRRNPPGAVDRHIKWERSRENAILEWKNLKRIQAGRDTSIDIANIEMLRPSVLPEKGTTHMSSAQIPGHFPPGAGVPDKNWTETFGSTVAKGSPLAAAELKEKRKLQMAKAREARTKKLEAKRQKLEAQLSAEQSQE